MKMLPSTARYVLIVDDRFGGVSLGRQLRVDLYAVINRLSLSEVSHRLSSACS
jgi:hypothetical protein